MALQRGRLCHKAFRDLAVETRRARGVAASASSTADEQNYQHKQVRLPFSIARGRQALFVGAADVANLQSVSATQNAADQEIWVDCHAGPIIKPFKPPLQSMKRTKGFGRKLRDHKSCPSWLLRSTGSSRFSAAMRPGKASPPMPAATRRSAPSRTPARRWDHRPK